MIYKLILTKEQFKYITKCVAYGLSCFSPACETYKEKHKLIKDLIDMFDLIEDDHRNYESPFCDVEE